MPNPTGVNGHGKKHYPPDNVLKAHLQKNATKTVKEKLLELKKAFDLDIRPETLRKHERRLEIKTVRRNGLTEQEAVEAIIAEVEKDVNQNNGPRFIKDSLALKNILLPRNFVRNIMLEVQPEGFDKRVPGARRQQIRRVALTSMGPQAEFCADGHEKLASKALKICGDVGLPIYGYKDKFSGYVVLLKVIPNCRSAGTIGHLYLNMIEELQCIPLQLTTDNGAEVVWQSAIQNGLREIFTPDAYPPHKTVSSVHNTPIEGFWPWLKDKIGLNVKHHILHGVEEGKFNGDSDIHKNLFNWIFPTLMQETLDNFREYWNNHRIRSQADKILPSGHVPSHMWAVGEEYNYIDCKVPINQAAIDEIRSNLTEEVGPAEDHLRWVDGDYEDLFKQVYEEAGSPVINWETCWDVFSVIAAAAHQLLNQ